MIPRLLFLQRPLAHHELARSGRAGALLRLAVLIAALAAGADVDVRAQAPDADARDRRIEQLEKMIEKLSKEIEAMKTQRGEEKARADSQDKTVAQLAREFQAMKESPFIDPQGWYNRFSFGGYGELHANFGEGKSPDQFDIHRLVGYVGYDFSDWIKFRSEIEVEHAFVKSGSGGEVTVEQASVDIMLCGPVTGRVGRILTPLGITNRKHEPPSFLGVERPAFDRVIIPTTWPSDGAGIYGQLTPSLTYEAYVVGSLDGSKFNAMDGIRPGRIKESPSLHEPAFTGRVDYFPFVERPVRHAQVLRLGASTYLGGLDNANQGKTSGIDGDIQIFSGDFEYSIWKFDFRGALAHEKINGARQIGRGTASEILGWYLEAGYHFWPEAWKRGKLAKSDAVVFARYDDFDTQFKMPSGVARNPAGDRSEWTFGVNFYLTPTFVLKADFQIPEDATGSDLDKKINLGVGWQF